MNLFAASEVKEEEKKSSSSGIGFVLVLLAIPFLGSVLIGLLAYFLLLRVARLKLSMASIILGALALVSLGYIALSSALNQFLVVFNNLSLFTTLWTDLIPFYVAASLLLGSIIGFAIIAFEIHKIKNEKSITRLEGLWQYGFEFRKTPWEIKRKEKTIEALKAGALHDATRNPLGYDEENELPAFKYIDEAVKMMLVVGAAGSGKALHKDTTIPTPFGKSTVENLSVGDVIFNEVGNHTTIIGKYQPMTEDHYVLTFSDGTKVKACGDHLWSVLELDHRGDFKEVIGKPMFTDLVFSELSQLAHSNNEELVSFADLQRRFNPTRSGSFRRTLNAIEADYSESIYSINELVANLKGKRNAVSDKDIINTLSYLEDQKNEYVSRSQLNSIISDGAKIDRWTHKIEDKIIARSRVFKLNRAAQALVEKESAYRQIVDKSALREITLNTREMYDNQINKTKHKNLYAIKVNTNGVDYPRQDLLVDPYTFGAWLGDDNSRNGNVCGADPEVFEEIEKSYELKRLVHDGGSAGDMINAVYPKLTNDLRTLNLLMGSGDKTSKKDIPNEYIYSSRDQRIALLSGLLDTDGTVSKDGTISIGLTNLKVIEKAREIVASLGYNPSKIHSKLPKVKYAGVEKIGKEAYSFSFIPKEQFFKITRKAIRVEDRLAKDLAQQARHDRRYIVAIEKIEDKKEDYYCFEVDSPSHLFLCTDSFITTHNTISMLSMMLSDIEAGRTVLAVDFKRSPEFAAKLAKWSKERDVDFYHFESGSPKKYRIEGSLGQVTYDPFASGSGAEMLLGMREYDTASAVYKTNMVQVLQIVFAMMKQADKSKAPNIDWHHGGIYQVASAIKQDNLKDLLNACENRPIYNDAAELVHASNSKNNISHSLEELRGQMRTIVASDYGRWFKIDDNNKDRHIDLKKLLMQDKQSVILFSFNSEDEPELAQSVGSMIFADLRAVSGHIRNAVAERVTNVYVDEFQAVPPTAVTGLLEKARSSKIAMTLAQQSFEQIITSSPSNGEAYLDSILVTCSNFLIHAGMTLPAAERVSNILGKEEITIYSKTQKNSAFFLSLNFGNKRDQVISERKEEKWKRNPNEFMELAAPMKQNGHRSEAILVNKAIADPNFDVSGSISRKLWMIPQKDVLTDYVKPQIGGFDDDELDDFITDYNKAPKSTEELLFDSEKEKPSPMQQHVVPMKNETTGLKEDFSFIDDAPMSQSEIHAGPQDDGGFGFEVIEEEVMPRITDSALEGFDSEFKPRTLADAKMQKIEIDVIKSEAQQLAEIKAQPQASPNRPSRIPMQPKRSPQAGGLPQEPQASQRPSPQRAPGRASPQQPSGVQPRPNPQAQPQPKRSPQPRRPSGGLPLD